jgi:hypothetical protein
MVATSQLELCLPRAVDTADLEAAKRALVEVLSGRGWMTARELREMGFNDRVLRLIVEADEDGEILSYPGSPGYRLFDEAPFAELDGVKALKSQGRAMLRRFVRYERRRHGRIER